LNWLGCREGIALAERAVAKIRNPVTFSAQFGVDESRMVSLGAFNPTLNLDTKLFVDPVLLGGSRARELREDATARFNSYFGEVVTLISASARDGDAPWRQAVRRLAFHEVKETCLGYGGGGISGSAFGADLQSRILATAREIIGLGVHDPELFKLLPLLEEGVGSDRISDMTTHVILPDLLSYTARIARELGVQTEALHLKDVTYNVPMNPFVRRASRIFAGVEGLRGGPVILAPRDVLRDLPVARDWDEVVDAAARNSEVRRRVNEHIGAIWDRRIRTRREKSDLRRVVLSSREAFEAMLATLRQSEHSSYDFNDDPHNLYRWRRVSQEIAGEHPLLLALPASPDADAVKEVVAKIVAQFRHLVEDRGLARLLWNGSTPRRESAAQMLFFAVAYSYCKANNLDITPEADTGSGVVDFKVSAGFSARVLVETKLSTNSGLVAGYVNQLGAYRDAEETVHATYLVVDVGRMGQKEQELARIKGEREAAGEPVSEIVIVDGEIRPSASRR
jgi:hypothetical protein